MNVAELQVSVPIPEGVTVEVNGPIVTAKGKAGEVSKRLKHQKITIESKGDEVVLTAKKATKREKMFLHTFRAHVRNLLQGCSEGFVYELKICSGHFPMSAAVKGDTFELKNFLGEATPRKLKLKQGPKVAVNGDTIVVECANKELAGQVSADLEKLTRITNKDRRIFQDGIYITKKAGKEV